MASVHGSISNLHGAAGVVDEPDVGQSLALELLLPQSLGHPVALRNFSSVQYPRGEACQNDGEEDDWSQKAIVIAIVLGACA